MSASLQQILLLLVLSIYFILHLYFIAFYLFIYLFFGLFAVSWAAPTAYGGSQARGQMGAVAIGLCHIHSNARSEPCM